MRKTRVSRERSFGVSVGAMLVLIAVALWWRGRVGRSEIIGATGLLLCTCGVLRPALLRWPSHWWWRFAGALGYVNARVLLTVLFSVVLVPIAVIWRCAGVDPLARRRSNFPGWVPYPARYRQRKHYERMY
jgi:saxitoxin biosynthesis operon SxtJ-like protein